MLEPHVTAHPPFQDSSAPLVADATAEASDSAISVTFNNYSKVQWSLDYWGYDYQTGFSGPSSEPSNPLEANAGIQTFAQSQVLSTLDQGPISIFCTWRDPNGYRFGVNLIAHFQFFGMGKRPSWTVMVDHNAAYDSEPSWMDNGGPATTYTWDRSQIPYKIVATPDSGHTTLSVNVIITDLPTHS